MTKNILNFSLMTAFIAALLTNVGQSSADEFLTIGDKAPSINIEHWVSDRDGEFEHIEELEEGKVYVVEFWATWCGPCIASMPDLAELQDEYADKGVQIISVSDEDLKTVESFLERKVRGEKKKTYGELTASYCLTADPDRSVHKEYFRAAGRTGIPCAFIVGKSGLIEWIGHPARMEKPLDSVVNDDWDRDEFMEEYEASQQAARVQAKLSQSMQKVEGLMADGETEEAMEILDDLIANDDYEEFAPQLENVKGQLVGAAVGEMDDKEALEFLKTFVTDNKAEDKAMMLNNVAWAIYEKHEKEGVSDELLKAATDAAALAVKNAPEEWAILDTLAHFHHANGDLDGAIEVQEKSVKNAGRNRGQVAPYLKKLKAEKKKAEADDDDDEKDDDK